MRYLRVWSSRSGLQGDGHSRSSRWAHVPVFAAAEPLPTFISNVFPLSFSSLTVRMIRIPIGLGAIPAIQHVLNSQRVQVMPQAQKTDDVPAEPVDVDPATLERRVARLVQEGRQLVVVELAHLNVVMAVVDHRDLAPFVQPHGRRAWRGARRVDARFLARLPLPASELGPVRGRRVRPPNAPVRNVQRFRLAGAAHVVVVVWRWFPAAAAAWSSSCCSSSIDCNAALLR